MIYNLSEYVKNNLGITPVTNGYDPGTEDDSLFLTDSGGLVSNRIGTRFNSCQFISCYSDRVTAKEIIDQVFKLLSNRYNITLPEVTVKEIVYEEVVIASILAIQLPAPIGANINGLHEWSVNFTLAYGGK